MADDVEISAGTGTKIATDQVTTTNEHVQLIKIAIATDGSRTLVPADATAGLLVNPGSGATNLGKAEDAAHADAHVGVMALGVRNYAGAGADGDYSALTVATDGHLIVDCMGSVAHDAVDANEPVKIGYKAIAHGTNPTAVAAADRTDAYANRAGIPFVMGGHPNVVTIKHANITTAVTDTAVVTVAGGLKIVVTGFQVTLDNASTVFPTVLLGFGTTNTPTTTGVIGCHGGVPAGGGFGRGDGSGIIGIGADGEDLRITTTGNATGNGLQLVVSYYTIES